jgi:divalent metal cation (Fe/Co/Zn/Cd) transporter
MAILGFSILLEGYSLLACIKEIRTQNKKSLWHWFRHTKSSELLVLFTENAAALVGLAIATVFLGLAWCTGEAFWDAVGSIFVGCVLVTVAMLLAIEIKSFIIGEAASTELKLVTERTVTQFFKTGRILRYIAIQTGTDEIMMSCKIHPGQINDLSTAIDLVNQFEKQMKINYPSLKWQFIELDNKD